MLLRLKDVGIRDTLGHYLWSNLRDLVCSTDHM